MGIATFEIESKFEMAMAKEEQSDYECWLDYVESEGWTHRMIEDENENEMMMRAEVINILKIDSITEPELRSHLSLHAVSREKI